MLNRFLNMGGPVSIDPESWIFVDKSPNFMSFMSRHLFSIVA